MTAGARWSLQVTRRWRSAGRAPCLHGAGRQADGVRQATTALLHTIHHQYSAERGPPQYGRRKAVHVTGEAWSARPACMGQGVRRMVAAELL
jgi:hypothetical protein